jgi:hypothetical protein
LFVKLLIPSLSRHRSADSLVRVSSKSKA